MPFTGQLGTSNSQPGNIELGAAGASATTITSGSFTVADTGAGADLFAVVSISPISQGESGAGADLFTLASLSDIGTLCTVLGGTLGPRQYRYGPEHYLPSWTTPHARRSGLLFQVLQHLAEQEVPVQQEARRATLRQWLSQAEVGEQRIQWGIPKSFPVGRELLLTFSTVAGGSVVSGTVRQATSPFDFDSAVDPVWYATASDLRIWVRNLHMMQAVVVDGAGVYSICGELSEGLVPDTGLFYRRSTDNEWEWLSPESAAMSGRVSFSLPASGAWQVAYGSQKRLNALNASGMVMAAWAGGQSVPLRLLYQDPVNLFDGYGALIGIPRFPFEDNLAYKRRLLDEMEAPGDPTLGGVVRGICSRLGQLSKRVWDGVSDLTLDTTGASGITHVYLPQVDPFREVAESLAPSGGTLTARWVATHGAWQNGWLVLVNGIPEPDVLVAGNIVTLSRPVSGSVVATYSVRQYMVQTGASGYVSNLLAGTGLASGSYSVFCSRHVDAHGADLPDYQRSNLLDPSGLPNQLFLELAHRLTENNPTTFTRARWGLGAHWFAESEDQPPSSRLPIPMDVGAA